MFDKVLWMLLGAFLLFAVLLVIGTRRNRRIVQRKRRKLRLDESEPVPSGPNSIMDTKEDVVVVLGS